MQDNFYKNILNQKKFNLSVVPTIKKSLSVLGLDNELNSILNGRDFNDLNKFEKEIYQNYSHSRYIASQTINTGSLHIDYSTSPYTYSDYVDIFDKMENCADLLEVRKYESGEKVIHNANFCSNPHICAVCASRVSQRRRKIFDYVENKNPGEKYRLSIQEAAEKFNNAYMLTVTIENGPNLKNQLNKLQSSVRTFIRMGQKRKKGKSSGEWGKVKAAIGNVENKRGKTSGEWHSHIHFLIFSDEKVNYTVYNQDLKRELLKNGQVEKSKLLSIANEVISVNGNDTPVSKLSKEWFLASGSINISCEPLDLFPHISGYMTSKRKSRLHKLTNKIKELGLSRSQSIAMQAAEIFKYSTKFDGVDRRNHAADFVEVLGAMHNRRTFRTYGEFRARGDNEGTDFIEKEENESFNIFSVKFNGHSYGEEKPENRPLFQTSDKLDKYKKYCQKEAAKVQGAYRSKRNEYLKNRDTDSTLVQTTLDAMKADFRVIVRNIWDEYFKFYESTTIFKPDFV